MHRYALQTHKKQDKLQKYREWGNLIKIDCRNGYLYVASRI